MEVLLPLGLVTLSLCAAAAFLRRVGRKPTEQQSIQPGHVSSGWLSDYRVRRRDWTGLE